MGEWRHHPYLYLSLSLHETSPSDEANRERRMLTPAHGERQTALVEVRDARLVSCLGPVTTAITAATIRASTRTRCPKGICMSTQPLRMVLAQLNYRLCDYAENTAKIIRVI